MTTAPPSRLPSPASLLLAALPLLVYGNLFVPRPIAPATLAMLRLERDAVEAQITHDVDVAKAAPSDLSSRQLRKLFIDAGKAELTVQQSASGWNERTSTMRRLTSTVEQAQGTGALEALRAEAVVLFDQIMQGSGPVADEQARLGSFSNVLARHGATRSGWPLAPTFVIRTLYKVRWNRLHGLKPGIGLTAVERRAFYGWQALHGESLRPRRRLMALSAYAAAGGAETDETAAALLLFSGDLTGAQAALERADEARPSLRTRNHIAYLEALRQDGGP